MLLNDLQYVTRALLMIKKKYAICVLIFDSQLSMVTVIYVVNYVLSISWEKIYRKAMISLNYIFLRKIKTVIFKIKPKIYVGIN